MATGTLAWHGPAFISAFNKEVDYNSDTIKMAFATVTYVPDVDAHDYFNDMTNEVTGTNLSAGGVTLTTCVMTVVGASNIVKFTHDDVSVSTVTATGIRVCVIYDATPGTAATRPILGSAVLDSDVSPNAGTLTVDVDNTNGSLKVTY